LAHIPTSRWFSREGQPLYIVEGAPVQETTNPAMEDSNLAGSAPLHWLGHADETTQVGLVHLRTSNFGLPGYRRLNSPPSRWQPKGYRRLNLRFIARKSFGLPAPRALRDPPALRYWRYMRSVYLHGGPYIDLLLWEAAPIYTWFRSRWPIYRTGFEPDGPHIDIDMPCFCRRWPIYRPAF
jgi:hypothetical protein